VDGESSDAAAVLVGMPEFVVHAAVEEGREVWVLIETPPAPTACSGCGSRAESKGRRRTKVRDLEAGGRPVVLVWDKRRWRCPDPDCDVRTWTEQAEAIAPRAVLTERARFEIFRRIGEEGRSTAEVARAFGIAWATAWAAFEALARPAVEDPQRIGGVEALGVDETGFLAATPAHPCIFVTGLVDVRRGLLCDVIEGRSAAELRRWLLARPRVWLAGVEVVTIDPHEAYRIGLSPSLAHATVVADPFHIVRLANRAVDDVRRRTQQELTGHRGRRGDPLYDIRKVLLTGSERLTDRTRARLDAALAAGDPRDEVVATWLAKEHLREVYAVDDPVEAGVLLDAVIAECATSEVKELRRLGGTLRKWRTEILAHHVTGDSNGPTEAMNLLIKNIKRVGRGFTNFEHYRLRLLAHCGLEWQTHRTASMRGRSPHLAA
jgi:transposase